MTTHPDVFQAFRASPEYQALKDQVTALQREHPGTVEATVSLPAALPGLYALLAELAGDEPDLQDFLATELKRLEMVVITLLLQETTQFPFYDAVYQRVREEQG